MRKEYDFSKATKNPYAKKLKSRTTIRLDDEVIGYFQKLAKKSGVPYQTLINLYLKDCMVSKKAPDFKWKKIG
ncbi:MAG: BrnA antitoxin family protein [Bdellovibrionaceae bacterium]|jgi:predicted DNA binding CopG/RHH family protein|nr:BrnA antitoxin family protein [Pseudobdellovibrionaceae bacterium]